MDSTKKVMYDILGNDVLKEQISRSLNEIKIQSFIFNGEINEVNSVYLKFDDWIRLFFDDGVLFVFQGYDEKNPKIEDGIDDIEYRFVDLKNGNKNFDSILNKKLVSFNASENFELTLEFEDDILLIIAQMVLEPGFFGPTTIEIRPVSQ